MRATIVVMAAGLGSRYGSFKQMEGVGPNGELLMEYSIYDALRVGFDDAIIILRPDILDEFRERYGAAIEKNAAVRYVLQSYDTLPSGFIPPAGRTKPYGTVHAVLSAAGAIHNSFAVVNADDFYGRDAFAGMYRSLCGLPERGEMSMAAYRLCHTLSVHGGVTRGICRVRDGILQSVAETKGIQRGEDGAVYGGGGAVLDPDSLVSMNMWGCTPWALEEMDTAFRKFLSSAKGDPMQCEYVLPVFVDESIQNGRLRVNVQGTDSEWFGVTYRADHELAADRLRALYDRGEYPARLFY